MAEKNRDRPTGFEDLSDDTFLSMLPGAENVEQLTFNMLAEIERREELGLNLADHDEALAAAIEKFHDEIAQTMSRALEPFRLRVNEAFTPLADQLGIFSTKIARIEGLAPVAGHLGIKVPKFDFGIGDRSFLGPAHLEPLVWGSSSHLAPEIELDDVVVGDVNTRENLYHAAIENQTGTLERFASAATSELEGFNKRLEAIERNTSDNADASVTSLLQTEDEAVVSRAEFEKTRRDATLARKVAAVGVLVGVVGVIVAIVAVLS